MLRFWGNKFLDSALPETSSEELEKAGFTKLMLQDHEYSNAQKIALLKLVTNDKISSQQALEEVDQLTYYMCAAIINLHTKGLRGKHLREWVPPAMNPKKFSKGHLSTLTHLMEKHHFSPEQAINKLNALSEMEAIACQFEDLNLPADTIAMNKLMFAKTWTEYRYNNLRIEDFNNWTPDCHIQFTNTHKELMGKMITLLHIAPQKAINLISHQNISDVQAKELIKFINPNETREYAFSAFTRLSSTEKLELTTEQIKAILFEENSFVTYPTISQF